MWSAGPFVIGAITGAGVMFVVCLVLGFSSGRGDPSTPGSRGPRDRDLWAMQGPGRGQKPTLEDHLPLLARECEMIGVPLTDGLLRLKPVPPSPDGCKSCQFARKDPYFVETSVRGAYWCELAREYHGKLERPSCSIPMLSAWLGSLCIWSSGNGLTATAMADERRMREALEALATYLEDALHQARLEAISAAYTEV